MKNLLIIFMALATFGMTAQNKNLNKKEHHKEMKSNLTPEQRVDLRVKKMTTSLDLNADQQAKMKKILLERSIERSGMYKNRNEMTVVQKEEAKKNMLDRRIAFKKQMTEILTKEQVTKWESLQSEKRGKTKGGKMHKNKLKD